MEKIDNVDLQILRILQKDSKLILIGRPNQINSLKQLYDV